MINIGFSITIFGQNYLDKFFKYTLPPIIFFFNKSKNYKLILFLHSTKKEFDHINYKLSLSNINYSIEFKELDLETIKNFTYKNLSKFQNEDLKLSYMKCVKYLYFLYADMFFNFELIENTIQLLNRSPNSKGCYTFALELENNNYLDEFYSNLKKNINKAKQYLIDNYLKLISEFHKNYILGTGVPTNYNFLIIKDEDTILVKSLDFHPIVVNVSLNEKNELNSIAIDKNFLFRNDIQKWLLIGEMSKVCCFSISNNKDLRNFKRNYNQILTNEENENIYIANWQSKILKLSYLKKKIFYDKFISLSKSDNKKPYILNKIFQKKLTYKKNDLKYFLRLISKISIKNLAINSFALIYFKLFFKKKLYLKTMYRCKEIILLTSIIRIIIN
jgi:hypothetical protein